jgi:hypothetical protein
MLKTPFKMDCFKRLSVFKRVTTRNKRQKKSLGFNYTGYIQFFKLIKDYFNDNQIIQS